MVNITMAVPGAITPIRLAASSPFITGIWKSSITTSGCNSSTFSTAIWPFSASPHTSHAEFFAIQDLSEARIKALSSTIRILRVISQASSPLAGCWPGQVQLDGYEEG